MWCYAITFNGRTVGLSTRTYSSSVDAERNAKIDCAKMNEMSGCLYDYKVYIGDFDL